MARRGRRGPSESRVPLDRSVLRARRAGEVTVLDGAPARTSPRRFLRAGVLKSNAINALTLLWWHVGATPTQLFRLYYGK